MPILSKILIANRGEIAVRVIRTCQDMGIATVAVCSEADLRAPHVALADEAVVLGPAPAAESYLNIPAIILAARETGADAVHPGYGFLSENADFAEACEAAGLVFIGPRAETVRLMGSKARARALAEERGVPVVPGYHGEDQSDEALEAAAEDVGFPILVKASAGGGGKGMRIVREAAALPEALAAARREARAAFGDDRLLLERYIEGPRHIEVQIFGDQGGEVIHLFERECSIQRRHQKIIEESPSPAVDEALREDLTDAAVEMGRACGYVGAGTVEFIVDEDGRFYFLEVNTRLQVEHPVTEMVMGLDLVRLQIEVAQGRMLALDPALMEPMGHAIECRIYAEDAAAGFLPATGRVLCWEEPDLPWLRIDRGVEEGTEVSIHYDPMLAKIITHGDDRGEALRRMAWALSHVTCLGVTTNLAFLSRVIRHASFVDGDFDTHFIDDLRGELLPAAGQGAGGAPPVGADGLPLLPGAPPTSALLAVVTVAEHALRRAADPLLPEIPTGWRNNRFADQAARWEVGGAEIEVRYRDLGQARYRLAIGPWFGDATLLAVEGGDGEGRWDSPLSLRLSLSGRVARWRVARDGARFFVQGPGGVGSCALLPRFPRAAGAGSVGGAVAPMPGKVLDVKVNPGDAVEAGQALVILEAMKMEHTLIAERDGVVEAVSVAAGDVVEAGAVLVSLADPVTPRG